MVIVILGRNMPVACVLHRIVDHQAANFEDVTVRSFDLLIDSASSIQSIRDGLNLPSSSDLLLTLDDGHLSDFTIVFPRLIERGYKATFFVVPSFIGRPGFMSRSEIKIMHESGMEIGSHSFSHPDFRRLSNAERRNELLDSKHYLEDLLGDDVASFAFPFGFYTSDCVSLVAESGYSYCCNSRHGVAGNDSFLVPRNSINRQTGVAVLSKMSRPPGFMQVSWLLEDKVKSVLKHLPSSWYGAIRSLVSRDG